MKLNFTPIPAVFVRKINRFVGEVLLNGKDILVHIPNSGRLQEILVSGREVYLREGKNPNRKYQYDLALAKMPDSLVLIDSLLPNKVFQEFLQKNILNPFTQQIEKIEAESSLGKSRFDFKVKTKGKIGFIEIKSVTLVNEGEAMFPDAPTVRGVKHLEELTLLTPSFLTAVIFLICRQDAVLFRPNSTCDPDFAEALIKAAQKGVIIKAYRLKVNLDRIEFDEEVEVVLSKQKLF